MSFFLLKVIFQQEFNYSIITTTMQQKRFKQPSKWKTPEQINKTQSQQNCLQLGFRQQQPSLFLRKSYKTEPYPKPLEVKLMSSPQKTTMILLMLMQIQMQIKVLITRKLLGKFYKRAITTKELWQIGLTYSNAIKTQKLNNIKLSSSPCWVLTAKEDCLSRFWKLYESPCRSFKRINEEESEVELALGWILHF